MTTDLVDEQRFYSDVLAIYETLQQSDAPFGEIQHRVVSTFGPCRLGDDLITLAATPEEHSVLQAQDFIHNVGRAVAQEGFYGWISRMLATVTRPFQHSYVHHGPEAVETHGLRMDIDDICRMAGYVLLTYGHKNELNHELLKQFLQADHVHLMTVSLPKVCADLGLPTFTPREVTIDLSDGNRAEPVHIPFDSGTLTTHEQAPGQSDPEDADTSPVAEITAPQVPWGGAAQQILFDIHMLNSVAESKQGPQVLSIESPWFDSDFRLRRLQRFAGPRILAPALAHALATDDDLSRAREWLTALAQVVSAGGPLALAPTLTEEAFEYLHTLRVDTDGSESEAARQWVRQVCADAAFVVLSWGADLHQSWTLARHLFTGDMELYSTLVDPLFEPVTAS